MRPLMADAGTFPLVNENQRTAVAELTRPLARLALGGLIAVSPFRARLILDERPAAPVYGDYTDLLLFAGDFFLVAILALWGLSLLTQPRRVWLGPALVRWPVVLLLLAVWASVPFSFEPALSLFNAARITGLVALAVYCANEIESISQVVPAVAAAVVIQAVTGISQVLDQASIGLPQLGEHRLDPNVSGVSIVWTESEPKLLRAYGLTDHPNILGGVLALSLLIVASGLSIARPAWSMLLGAVFALGAVALLLTFSRTGILSLTLGLVLVMGLLAYRRQLAQLQLWLGVCLAAALIGAAFIKPYAPYLGARANPTAQQTGSTESRALSEREALAEGANKIFIARPVTGVGVGALPVAMRDTYPDFGFNYQPAHFVLLDVAAETGLAGALGYALLLVSPWLLLFWRRHQLTPELIGVSGALLALGVIGLFDYYTWSLAPGQLWAWLVLGLWLGAYRRAQGATADA